MYEVRRAIGAPDRIQTCSNGYIFHVTDDDYLDLRSFRDLHAEGEVALAHGDLRLGAAKLKEALSVWREPVLADSPASALSYGAAKALLEERVLTQQLLIDAMLALGYHRDAVVMLYQLTAADPLRERWWELLMLALYRCGDQAAALEAFTLARSMLVENCGIDPGPALQTLHRRILTADPVLRKWPEQTSAKRQGSAAREARGTLSPLSHRARIL